MKKIIVIFLIILAVSLIGLQVFLKFALTDTLARHIIPEAEKITGVKIELDHASVNLLRLSALITGLSIGNPEGFEEPELAIADYFSINLDIPALIRRKPIEVKQLRVRKARLDIVRNINGEINVRKLLEQIQEGSHTQQPEKELPATEQAMPDRTEKQDQEPLVESSETIEELPPFMLRRARTGITVRYIDHNISPGDPFTITLESETNIRNLSSRQSDRQPPGRVAIHGTISSGDENIPFNLHGLIDPLTDPTMPTFEMEGEIETINLGVIGPYLRKNLSDIQAGSVSATFSLVCKEGVFDSRKSVFNLTFHDITLSEERSRKIGGVKLPPRITAPVHIGGTLMEPKADSSEIAKSILSATLQGLGAKKLPLDKDSLKDAPAGATKAIGGLFDKIRGRRDSDKEEE